MRSYLPVAELLHLPVFNDRSTFASTFFPWRINLLLAAWVFTFWQSRYQRNLRIDTELFSHRISVVKLGARDHNGLAFRITQCEKVFITILLRWQDAKTFVAKELSSFHTDAYIFFDNFDFAQILSNTVNFVPNLWIIVLTLVINCSDSFL